MFDRRGAESYRVDPGAVEIADRFRAEKLPTYLVVGVPLLLHQEDIATGGRETQSRHATSESSTDHEVIGRQPVFAWTRLVHGRFLLLTHRRAGAYLRIEKSSARRPA